MDASKGDNGGGDGGARILDWIDALPGGVSPGRRKRKRPGPPTPPETTTRQSAGRPTRTLMETPPSKRHRALASRTASAATAAAPPDDGDEAERTPRPAHRSRHAVLASSESSRTSSRSRRTGSNSNPRKRQAEIEVEPEEAIEVCEFDNRRMPDELVRLAEEIDDSANGLVPVLHQSLRQELREFEAVAQRERRRGHEFKDSDFTEETPAVAPAVPPVGDVSAGRVAEVLMAAQRCAQRKQDENGWNQAVHFPLLRLALPAGGDIDFEPW
jgi:hypothetical protein